MNIRLNNNLCCFKNAKQKKLINKIFVCHTQEIISTMIKKTKILISKKFLIRLVSKLKLYFESPET